MPSGYVALLDVLGFSALVTADSTNKEVERYSRCLQEVLKSTEVKYVVFSDSIVLTIEGDGPDSLIKIAQACSQLMHRLLVENIPIRGAISQGKFVRSVISESVFVAGNAILDAYYFEQAQNWVGIMISPKVLKCIPDIGTRCHFHDEADTKAGESQFNEWTAFIQPNHGIPFHTKNSEEPSNFDGFAIVPTLGFITLESIHDNIEVAINQLISLKSIAPNPSSQQKYQKTIDWLRLVLPIWQNRTIRITHI